MAVIIARNPKIAAALCRFFFAAAVAYASSAVGAPDGTDAKNAQRPVCRFTLGAIFEASDHENRDLFLKDCQLHLKQVVKALDECKLTVVQNKAAPKSGQQSNHFRDLELLVEGKKAFVLKDKTGKDISLEVKDVKLALSSINSSKKPTRYEFLIGFSIAGKHSVKLFGFLDGEHTFTWGFTSPWYGYDAEGKPFDPKTIYKD